MTIISNINKANAAFDAGQSAYYSDEYRLHNAWIKYSGLDEKEIAATDIDLAVRSGYGGKGNFEGKIKLLEFKLGNAQLRRGQEVTYHIMDRLMREGDKAIYGTEYVKYEGFYLCRADKEFWQDYKDDSRLRVCVNDRYYLTRQSFLDFLRGRLYVEPMQIKKTWD